MVPRFDTTCEPLLTFLDLIYSISMRGSREDKLYWKPAKGRGFKVGGYHCSLMPTIVMSFPWKIIWRSKVPPSIAFFSWIVTYGKFFTINNLWNRHISVKLVLYTYMCKSSGQTMDHLLLHYSYKDVALWYV